MPIVDLDPLPLGMGIDRPEKGFVTPGIEETHERPSMGELTRATFRRENLLASAAQVSNGIDTTPDPDFKPFDQIKGTPYERHFNAFLDVQNRPQFDEVKRRLDQDDEDRKIVDAAPLWMSLPASLMANVTDPTILAPGGAFVRGAKGGWSMLKSGTAVGAAAAGATAGQEAFLHGTQFTRTPEESAFNVGSSFILGGLLGTGGSALLNRAEWKSHVRALDRELANTDTRAIKDNPVTAPIYEDIANQLRATKHPGMTEDYIEKVAALTAARYQAKAERLGGSVSAEDLYKAQGIEVRGTGAPAAEGRAFEQAAGRPPNLLDTLRFRLRVALGRDVSEGAASTAPFYRPYEIPQTREPSAAPANINVPGGRFEWRSNQPGRGLRFGDEAPETVYDAAVKANKKFLTPREIKQLEKEVNDITDKALAEKREEFTKEEQARIRAIEDKIRAERPPAEPDYWYTSGHGQTLASIQAHGVYNKARGYHDYTYQATTWRTGTHENGKGYETADKKSPKFGTLESAREWAEAHLTGREPDVAKLLEDEKPRVRERDAQRAREAFGIIEGEPRSFNQSQPLAPKWFSAVSRAIDESKQAKAPASQWLGMLDNLKQKGVKEEELEWLGLRDWLKDQKGSVTKQQVQDYVRANSIEVQEVMKGEDKVDITGWSAKPHNLYSPEIPPERVDPKSQTHWKIYDPQGNYKTAVSFADAMTQEDAIRFAMRENARLAGADMPKFQTYQLPGGENYRELLLTLPESTPGARAEIEQIRSRLAKIENRLNEYPAPTGPDRANLEREYSGLDDRLGRLQETAKSDFRSSHWEEPNVLAHIRFNDRVIDGKKTLFIEEIQSDWHQKGKKEGYLTPDRKRSDEVRLAELRPKIDALDEELDRSVETYMRDKDRPAFDARQREIHDRRTPLEQERVAIMDRLRSDHYANAVPDAPFKTTWPELSLKRMLRYAAENGYEQIAWTPGKVQAERYDLSKQISKLEFYSPDGKEGTLFAHDHNGRRVIDRNVMDAEKELPDIVGKDVAEKLLNQEGRTVENSLYPMRSLSGLDLKVGGEGMHGFYDQILPAAANKLTKKYGARVGETTLEGGRAKAMEEARSDIERRFSAGEIDRQGYEAELVHLEGPGGQVGTRPDVPGVHTLPITQQLREAALSEGLPLFQRGAEDATARGRITLASNKAIIDLFESANKSTFLHEMGHKWLDELASDAARADVPQALKDDLGTVLRWLGVDTAEKIGTKEHEQWAQAFERYLAEGKAPSSALAQAFESFKQWLISIYKSLANIDTKITDDIRGVMDRMIASDAEIRANRAYGPGSVGAAATEVPSLGQTAIAGRVAGTAAAATQRLNPGLRLAHSEVPEVRDVGMNLFEMSQYIRGNQDGLASPVAVETLRKEWNGGLMNAVRDTRAVYRDYRKGGGDLSRADFQAAVGRAMRRGDEDPIPEVAKVAKAWRKEVFDPLKEAAIEAGLLPKDVDVETAISYFSRLWNREKLIAQERAFKDVVMDWVAQNFPTWERAAAQATERRLEPLRREIDDLEMAKLRRGEERKLREDEIVAGEFTEADIRNALRIVQGGAPKPKGVKTLTQFLVENGGLYDPGGDVRHMGINSKSRPGLLRKERKRFQSDGGGMGLDEATQKAWDAGYFPDHSERPTIHDFLEALSDDFNKRRAVVRHGDQEAYRLQELIDQIDQDLARVGASSTEGPRFSTSEETKGIVDRVFKAVDAEADRRLEALKKALKERETDARLEHEARFGNPTDAGRGIADEVFNTLTGRTSEGVRPEFITIKARGPLKERTFNIPDELIERWLEDDVDLVGRRYSRIMSADVELARKFGSVDMKEQIQKVHEAYDKLRAQVTEDVKAPAAKSGTPPVKPGFVRFFHGGDNPGAGGGRWVTTDPNYARDFRSGGTPKDVHYVDIPKGDATEVAARAWDDLDAGTNMVGRYNHIEVPEHWAKQMKPFEPAGSAAPASAGSRDIEKRLQALDKQETADIRDIEGVRDIIRGTYAQSGWEKDFGRVVRIANNVQYIVKMGQLVLSSLTEPVRVVAAKGLIPFMGDAFKGLSNPAALKASIEEARLAGNINDKILAHRLSTVADLTDFYGSRGPVEKALDNMTNVASSWNGIRLWTDGVKMLASTMIQNKILRTVAEYGAAKDPDKRYLNFLGINQGMAERIAKQFNEHGDVVNGVHVAGTEKWTDEVAKRHYRAALNKDLDSMVVTRGAADLPLFANTPLGRLIFQFNTFNMASHQRILLRGLQEGHARFLSGVVALTTMGMLQTYLSALATNSVNRLPDFETNKGWWISEGLDRSGLFMLPMQISNGVEKLTGINPIKSPIKAGDEGSTISQKNRNRNELGVLGPTAGTIQDIGTAVGIPKTLYQGEDVKQSQKNALERLFPFNSYAGLRQILKYFVNPPTE